MKIFLSMKQKQQKKQRVMDSLRRIGWLTNCMVKSPLQKPPAVPCYVSRRPVMVPQTSVRPVRSEITVDDDVLERFLRERQSSGDLISRVSDMLWQRDALNSLQTPLSQSSDEGQVIMEEEEEDDDVDNDGGFLKLSRTQDWLLGDNSAPRNKKDIAKALQDDRERRKRLNLLQYEAIKRELWVLSIGIGSGCTVYCLAVLSVQAAVSYAMGVAFSCLYLQLLYKHADGLSREQVPQVFRQKKSNKKIGITSQDLKRGFERSIKGSAMALSSPRLVVPAAIYGMWIMSHSSKLFDIEIVPAMLGMFVYKAAALVQVYRDNRHLHFLFPQDDLF